MAVCDDQMNLGSFHVAMRVVRLASGGQVLPTAAAYKRPGRRGEVKHNRYAVAMRPRPEARSADLCCPPAQNRISAPPEHWGHPADRPHPLQTNGKRRTTIASCEGQDTTNTYPPVLGCEARLVFFPHALVSSVDVQRVLNFTDAMSLAHEFN